MRPFTCKDFCKISSDQSSITSDGRHLSSDGPSYVANLPGNFALAQYPLRHIHVLPKDELSNTSSSVTTPYLSIWSAVVIAIH